MQTNGSQSVAVCIRWQKFSKNGLYSKMMCGIWADISRCPLIRLARRLHCVPPPRCGVSTAIAAAVTFGIINFRFKI